MNVFALVKEKGSCIASDYEFMPLYYDNEHF